MAEIKNQSNKFTWFKCSLSSKNIKYTIFFVQPLQKIISITQLVRNCINQQKWNISRNKLLMHWQLNSELIVNYFNIWELNRVRDRYNFLY